MSLSDLGSLAEFVGAFALVVSVVYLEAQIRQNTLSIRAADFQGVSDARQDLLIHIS